MAKSKNMAFNLGAIAVAIIIVVGIIYLKGSRKDEERGVLFAQEEIRPTPTKEMLPEVLEENLPPLMAPTPEPVQPDTEFKPKVSERYAEEVRKQAKTVRDEVVSNTLREYIQVAETQIVSLRESLTDLLREQFSNNQKARDDAYLQYMKLVEKTQEERRAYFDNLDDYSKRDGLARKLERAIADLDTVAEKSDDIFAGKPKNEASIQGIIDKQFVPIHAALAELKKQI